MHGLNDPLPPPLIFAVHYKEINLVIQLLFLHFNSIVGLWVVEVQPDVGHSFPRLLHTHQVREIKV